MRSPGLKTCQNSKSTNELHLPGFADTFFSAQPSAREQIFRDLPTTSYSTPAAPMLDKIYRDLYLDRLTGRGAMRMVTMTDVTAVREEKGEVVLMTTERKTGRAEELRCNLVLLGTGYAREMPAVIQGLARALGLDRIEITRNCRLQAKGRRCVLLSARRQCSDARHRRLTAQRARRARRRHYPRHSRRPYPDAPQPRCVGHDLS